jgi:hypothetical protein
MPHLPVKIKRIDGVKSLSEIIGQMIQPLFCFGVPVEAGVGDHGFNPAAFRPSFVASIATWSEQALVAAHEGGI